MANSSKHPLKALEMVHKIMLLMQTVFAIVAVILVSKKLVSPATKKLDDILQIVALIVSAICYFAGTGLYKKKVGMLRESNLPASEKFLQYRAASIVLWGMLEGATLLCFICFLLTATYSFLCLAAVLLFFFFIFGANRQKLILFLGLSQQEIDDLKGEKD